MTAEPQPPGHAEPPMPERWQDELRGWCQARALECGDKAQDRNIAERLQLGWAMSADTFASVMEKIDSMDPRNASPAPSEGATAPDALTQGAD